MDCEGDEELSSLFELIGLDESELDDEYHDFGDDEYALPDWVENEIPDEPVAVAAAVAAATAGATPMPKCAKEDYVVVSRMRRKAYTATSLWARKTESLAKELTPATEAERVAVAEAQRRRLEFEAECRQLNGGKAIKADDLKRHLRAAGSTCPGGITRGGVIDALIAAGGIPRPIELDPDQTVAVARATSDASRTIIYAGPGAGKTTTLCYFTAAAAATGKRILVLAYNVVAEETLAGRLKKLGVHRIPNTQLNSEGAGCAVLTFDKLAYRINHATDIADICGDDDDADPDDSEELAMPAVAAAPALADTYRVSIEAAANKASANGFGNWDFLIVDEAQDIMPSHAAIIEGILAAGGIRKPRLAVAGDPRQELYPGARWFSDLWAVAPPGDKVELRYNHRSNPAIVEALNAFSRKNFPTLHSEQISARVLKPGEEDNRALRVELINDSGGRRKGTGPAMSRDTAALAVGDAVGRAMAAGEPGSCYAVAPVTTNKFQLGPASALARQVVAAQRPGCLVYEATVADKLSGDYAIATSMKIKGTERDCVVVFGVDNDYSIVIDRAQLIRRIFVALSRARDMLVIVTRTQVKETIADIMGPVLKLAGANSGLVVVRERADVAPMQVIHVAGTGSGVGALNGLCACVGIELAAAAAAPRTIAALRLPIGDAAGDADFLGIYAETLVLQALGMPMVSRVEVVGSYDQVIHGVSLISREGVEPYIFAVVNPAAVDELRAVAARIKAAAIAAAASAAYLHAVLHYSLLIRREWTVSGRLAQPPPTLVAAAAAAAAAVRATAAAVARRPGFVTGTAGAFDAGGEPFAGDAYRRSGSFYLTPRRDAAYPYPPFTDIRKQPHIGFEVDAVVGGVPVELKHVAALGDVHRRQAAIYAAILGRSHALLINTSDGAFELVAAANRRQVENVARAAVACREARRLAIGPLASRTIQPPAGAIAGCLVAVDAETDPGGRPIEIGAVAYDADSGAVIGVFDERAEGITEDPSAVPPNRAAPFTDVEALTGLRGTGGPFAGLAAPGASAALAASFRTWIGRLPPRRAFLHWAGTERTLLGPSEVAIDAHRGVFIPWLEAGGAGRRDRTKLVDAVEQLLPSHAYAPHRAFEDALATVGVYVAAVAAGARL